MANEKQSDSIVEKIKEKFYSDIKTKIKISKEVIEEENEHLLKRRRHQKQTWFKEVVNEEIKELKKNEGLNLTDKDLENWKNLTQALQEADMTDEDREKLQKKLEWIVFSQEPDKPKELLKALEIDGRLKGVTSATYQKNWRIKKFEEQIEERKEELEKAATWEIEPLMAQLKALLEIAGKLTGRLLDEKGLQELINQFKKIRKTWSEEVVEIEDFKQELKKKAALEGAKEQFKKQWMAEWEEQFEALRKDGQSKEKKINDHLEKWQEQFEELKQSSKTVDENEEEQKKWVEEFKALQQSLKGMNEEGLKNWMAQFEALKQSSKTVDEDEEAEGKWRKQFKALEQSVKTADLKGMNEEGLKNWMAQFEALKQSSKTVDEDEEAEGKWRKQFKALQRSLKTAKGLNDLRNEEGLKNWMAQFEEFTKVAALKEKKTELIDLQSSILTIEGDKINMEKRIKWYESLLKRDEDLLKEYDESISKMKGQLQDFKNPNENLIEPVEGTIEISPKLEDWKSTFEDHKKVQKKVEQDLVKDLLEELEKNHSLTKQDYSSWVQDFKEAQDALKNNEGLKLMSSQDMADWLEQFKKLQENLENLNKWVRQFKRFQRTWSKEVLAKAKKEEKKLWMILWMGQFEISKEKKNNQDLITLQKTWFKRFEKKEMKEELDATKIGISFSGGGIRSASICLGVAKELYEKGLLEKADYISSVSGGGYANAYVQSKFKGNKKERIEMKDWIDLFKKFENNETIEKELDEFIKSIDLKMNQELKKQGKEMQKVLKYNKVLSSLKEFKTSLSNLKDKHSEHDLEDFFMVEYKKLIANDPKLKWKLDVMRNMEFNDIESERKLSVIDKMVEDLELINQELSSDPEIRDNLKKGLKGLCDSTYELKANYDNKKLLPKTFIEKMQKGGADYMSVQTKIIPSKLVSLLNIIGTILIGLLNPVILLASLGLLGFMITQSLFPEIQSIFNNEDWLIDSFNFIWFLAILGFWILGMIGYYFFNARLKIFQLINSLAIVGVGLPILIIVLIEYVNLNADLYSSLSKFNILLASDGVVNMWYVFFLFCGIVTLGFFTNINNISIGRIYGDSLTKAFGFNKSIHLSDLIKKNDNLSSSPFPIFNCCLNVAPADGQGDLNADYFLLSPLRMGSIMTGYKSTGKYITLSRAMTTSAAAVNTNMGTFSSGITRVLIGLFNFRMGALLYNPKNLKKHDDLLKKVNDEKTGKIQKRLIHIRLYYNSIFETKIWWPYYYFKSLFSNNSLESTFLDISDGGHIENLAVYELLKRECKLIIGVDAGMDAKYEFEDLKNLIKRAYNTLNIEINFREGYNPFEDTKPRYNPTKRAYMGSKKRFGIADILKFERGDDGKEKEGSYERIGTYVYIKSSLSQDLAPFPNDDKKKYKMINGIIDKSKPTFEYQVYNYKKYNSDFPHHSTSDQSFEPVQFRAYYDLGQSLCNDVFSDLTESSTRVNIIDKFKEMKEEENAAENPVENNNVS